MLNRLAITILYAARARARRRLRPVLVAVAALAAVAPAATAVAATSTFSATFEAERSADWAHPRGVGLIDCNGRH
jgi:hypothetical protein